MCASLLISAGILAAVLASCAANLQTFAEWSSVDFLYDQGQKQQDLRSGRLKPEDVVVLDSDLYIDSQKREYLFVSTPDVQPGTPFSLSSVTGVKGTGGYLLKPFPSPEWHKTGNCSNTITSIWRFKIDRLGRLWAIDSGLENVFVNPIRVCPPQLLVFDLVNLRIIRRYRIPEDQLKCDNLLLNLEVEVLGNDSFAYILDPTGFRMYVYSLAQDRSYFVDHPFFYPDPLYGFYEINGRNFTLMDGIFSASLGAKDSTGNRPLRFHAFSSGREGFVYTSVLRNEAQTQDPRNFRFYGEQRRYHTSVEVTDDNGIMIFANVEDNSLIKWDTKTTFSSRNFNVIAQDNVRLQFPTGMKIALGKDLLVTTTRLQNVITGNTARNQINYRILIWRNVSKDI